MLFIQNYYQYIFHNLEIKGTERRWGKLEYFRNVLWRKNWASLVALGKDKEDNEEIWGQCKHDIRRDPNCFFSKACELFIEDLTRRSWMVTMKGKDASQRQRGLSCYGHWYLWLSCQFGVRFYKPFGLDHGEKGNFGASGPPYLFLSLECNKAYLNIVIYTTTLRKRHVLLAAGNARDICISISWNEPG